MNLKASFSPVFVLSLLLALSACATRNQPTDIEVLPEITTSSSSENNTANDTEATANTTQAQTPDAMDASEAVEPKLVDLFDRLRKGFVFPDLESKHITQYEKWSTEHESYLDALFARGTPFLFHIIEEIEKRQLPMELALLPAVESAYKPTAVSQSLAGGLWQFMPATGRQFGLRQDWWYDGRSDALSSTTAALDYLTQLNKMFDGDWFLTLAAYNAGPGTVSRAVKENKAKGRQVGYQDLALRLETKRYIPKLVALKNIINNPEKFGIELPIIESKPYFEVLELNGQIDLKRFAHEAGIDQSELRHLNAGFKRWATSPEGPHRLLVPVNTNGDIDHAKLAIQNAPKLNYSNHKIAQGDSLGGIARKYDVSVKALQISNNLRGTNIRAGKNLLIPVSASHPAAVSNSKVSNRSLVNREEASANKELLHYVKRGDTLWSIARQYKVQINNLLSWNNISKNQILQLNQALLVMAN